MRRDDELIHTHLVGIGGTGMSALAGFLMGSGGTVTGSDVRRGRAVRMLERNAVHVSSGHAARNLPSGAARVVCSAAVPAGVPELVAARRRGIPVLTYPEALRDIASSRATVGVAGTHGKTTTTAMVAHVLASMGEDPSWIFGGVPGRGMTPWRAGRGDALVIEACEYARNLLAIPAKIGVITSIDDDHLDCYGSLEAVRATFLEFAMGVASRDGSLVLRAELELEQDLRRLGAAGVRVTTYGLEPGADLSARAVEVSEVGLSFELVEGGRSRGRIQLPLLGKHNIENSLAAIAVARARGHDALVAGRSLAGFQGAGRRMERVPAIADVVTFDDYAHHPTAVTAVLSCLRESFPGRRIVAVFEPHQVSRTRRHMNSFIAALGFADLTAVTEIYSARELDCDVSGRDISEGLQALGSSATFTPHLKDAVEFVLSEVKAGDVLVMMGAGDIGEGFASALRAAIEIPGHRVAG